MRRDSAPEDEIREIDTGVPMTRFARGWHCLGRAADFRTGTPTGVEAFGTRLAIFEDDEQRLQAIEARCPHRGGDLSRGSVKDGNLACPLHDWRWAGDGHCVDVPYSRQPPPAAARVRSWPTLEENKLLFVWNDPEGNPPAPEVAIPKIPDLDEWTDWSWDGTVVTGTHPREFVDNLVDCPHFFYLHFGVPSHFRVLLEGHTAAQYLRMTGRKDIGPGSEHDTTMSVYSVATYHGPAYLVNHQDFDLEGMKIYGIGLFTYYPVNAETMHLNWAMSIKRIDGLPDNVTQLIAKSMAESTSLALQQDVEIWRYKTRIDNPMLSEDDGPIYQLRRWFDQFYVDADAVTPTMTDRFEHEVEIETARQYWEQEVAAGLQAAAAAADSPS